MPVPAYSRATPSVRELVTALVGTLESALYHLNHVDYDDNFCAITFLNETTQAVGIPIVSHFRSWQDEFLAHI